MAFGQLDWLGLLGFVTLSHLAGQFGAADASRTARSSWYRGLKKGPLHPPVSVFGIVWTILYTLIGVAVFLVFQARPTGSEVAIAKWNAAIALWVVQLFFNAIWTPLFFGRRWLVASVIDIVLIFLFALAATILFFIFDVVAGALMIPYLAWTLFAFYLNTYIAIQNPSPTSSSKNKKNNNTWMEEQEYDE